MAVANFLIVTLPVTGRRLARRAFGFFRTAKVLRFAQVCT